MCRMQSVNAPMTSAKDPSARASPVLAACLLMIFLTSGCVRHENDTFQQSSPIEALATRNVPANAMAESQVRGHKVYQHYCAICHGDEGQGNGFNSTNLAVSPRDFTSPQFWQQATDERLLLTVANGGPAVGKSVLMPAWGRTLTDRQLHDVVAFLHTLVPRVESSNN